jgi:hypothetical protein
MPSSICNLINVYGTLITAFAAVITAFATGFIAVFTRTLWRATQAATDTQTHHTRILQRAYMEH